jgi:hypothetical protein
MPRLVPPFSKEGEHLVFESHTKGSGIKQEQRLEQSLAYVTVWLRSAHRWLTDRVSRDQYIRYGYSMKKDSALDKGCA